MASACYALGLQSDVDSLPFAKAELASPVLLLALLFFFVPMAAAPSDVTGRGAPAVSRLTVHRTTGVSRLQAPERVVKGALFA